MVTSGSDSDDSDCSEVLFPWLVVALWQGVEGLRFVRHYCSRCSPFSLFLNWTFVGDPSHRGDEQFDTVTYKVFCSSPFLHMMDSTRSSGWR